MAAFPIILLTLISLGGCATNKPNCATLEVPLRPIFKPISKSVFFAGMNEEARNIVNANAIAWLEYEDALLDQIEAHNRSCGQ